MLWWVRKSAFPKTTPGALRLLNAFPWALSLETKLSPKMTRLRGIEIMQNMREWSWDWVSLATGLRASQGPHHPTLSRAAGQQPLLWNFPWSQDPDYSETQDAELSHTQDKAESWEPWPINSVASVQLPNPPSLRPLMSLMCAQEGRPFRGW